MTQRRIKAECLRCGRVREIRSRCMCAACYTWACLHPELDPYDPTLWKRFVGFMLDTQVEWICERRMA